MTDPWEGFDTTRWYADQNIDPPRIMVRDNGRFTDLNLSGEPNQYIAEFAAKGFFLRTIHRTQWNDDPIIIDVQSLNGSAVIPRA